MPSVKICICPKDIYVKIIKRRIRLKNAALSFKGTYPAPHTQTG